ncbi:hypothetical protein [Sphingobacterium faecale]|uniref:Uncharacterized protein n=1 Tax=Sphingobacterium faecale TaxID=2803775 RepID=A0ABS1R4W4_9SPHI|nr:hypothetical protein [Sphingobacterium faecale]MBL1409042.1 hypothetical protein [Sphingobacterium faecale]
MPYQNVFVEFCEQIKSSIDQGTFAKLTFAKTMGDTELKNIYVQLRPLDNGAYDFVLNLRYKTEEIEQFYPAEEFFTALGTYIKNPFTSVVLFTTEMDLTFKINKKGAGSLVEQAPTFKHASPAMLEIAKHNPAH